TVATVQANNTELKPGSTPVRVNAGLSSLLTPVLGVVASAGYGNGFYESGENVSTWLGLLELRYAMGPTVGLGAGYSHDFADALIGNFYVDHAVFARASWQLGAKWQARLRGEVRFRSYGGVHDVPNLVVCGDASCSKSRSDVLPRLEASIDY